MESELPLASATTEAAAGCEVVIYTTVFYPGSVKLPHPRHRLPPAVLEKMNGDGGGGGSRGGDSNRDNTAGSGSSDCFVLVAGAGSAATLNAQYGEAALAPWRLVVVNDTATATAVGGVGGGGRRASRRLKIVPHLFFPASAYTVFVDWKLQLVQEPRALVHRTLVAQAADFAAFRHREFQWLRGSVSVAVKSVGGTYSSHHLIHSFIHAFMHSCIHAFIHSFTNGSPQ